jgi:hypothetical protein
MTIKDYKFKIFKVYYIYKIHLSYKMNGSVRIFQGSFELFPRLEKILHIGGQVIEGLNSRVVRPPDTFISHILCQ